MVDLVRHPLVDEILDARGDVGRGEHAAFEGYRNHAHRVHNFARAIAAAFHDLLVFDGLDYLEPSIEEAARYLRETGRDALEPFRRADWNDFAMGLLRGGIPREPAPVFRGGAALRRTGRT